MSAGSIENTVKIAVIGPGSRAVGGQSVQADLLITALRQEGFDVLFLPIAPPLPMGIKWVRRIPYLRTLVNLSRFLASLRKLSRVDVVHVFSASYASFLLAPAPAIIAAQYFGRRVVLNYHSGEAEDHLARWGKLVHPWLSRADEIIVPSPFLRDVFMRFGYSVRVVPNIVDTSRFRFRERTPLRPRLLSIRNLEPYYRVGDIIEAFHRLQKHHPDATLTIAGSGSEEADLRRLAASAGASIRFLGRVDPSALPAICDDADIFVNASVLDNQPVSLLEAFAAGLAVITTAPGDIRAMTRDGDLGTLVTERKPAAIANAVERLLEEPNEALRMTRAAREEVARYTWASVRDGWLAAYKGATAS